MGVAKQRYMNIMKAASQRSGWSYFLWGEEHVRALLLPKTHDLVQKYMLRKEYARAKDLMSYELLATHGGMYVDVNIEDIRLLPRHVARRTRNMRGEVFVACHETPYISKPYPYISNGFFATTRNHSILATILDAGGRRRIEAGENVPPNIATGPALLGWAMHGHSGVVMLPSVAVYPYVTWGPRNASDPCFDEHNLTIPCDRSRLPEQTLAIDHFVLGGTWTGYATRQPARVSRPRKVGLERANRTEPYYRSSLQ